MAISDMFSKEFYQNALLRHRKVYRAYLEVFNSEEGKVVLRDMCRAHGVLQHTFDKDPYMNAFLSGERNAVMRIIAILGMTPDDFINMAEEAKGDYDG